jgi:hypothetical protein
VKSLGLIRYNCRGRRAACEAAAAYASARAGSSAISNT